MRQVIQTFLDSLSAFAGIGIDCVRFGIDQSTKLYYKLLKSTEI